MTHMSYQEYRAESTRPQTSSPVAATATPARVNATPGPWTVSWTTTQDGSDGSGGDKRYSINGPGRQVCEKRAAWLPADEANARLIAAAPKLLEALRAIVHPDNDRKIEFRSREEYYIARIEGGELERARDAIAEAEGRVGARQGLAL